MPDFREGALTEDTLNASAALLYRWGTSGGRNRRSRHMLQEQSSKIFVHRFRNGNVQEKSESCFRYSRGGMPKRFRKLVEKFNALSQPTAAAISLMESVSSASS